MFGTPHLRTILISHYCLPFQLLTPHLPLLHTHTHTTHTPHTHTLTHTLLHTLHTALPHTWDNSLHRFYGIWFRSIGWTLPSLTTYHLPHLYLPYHYAGRQITPPGIRALLRTHALPPFLPHTRAHACAHARLLPRCALPRRARACLRPARARAFRATLPRCAGGARFCQRGGWFGRAWAGSCSMPATCCHQTLSG